MRPPEFRDGTVLSPPDDLAREHQRLTTPRDHLTQKETDDEDDDK